MLDTLRVGITRKRLVPHTQVCYRVCVRGISPSITGRILMELRMDIPVHHAQCVWQKYNMSKVKVKVTENTKTTIWAITFEPEVVEISGWFQKNSDQNTYQKCPHDARRSFLRHVTSTKTRFLHIF